MTACLSRRKWVKLFESISSLALQVFQPLLLEYFSYEELCELKNKVIDRHFHCEPEESIEKFLTEDAEREGGCYSVVMMQKNQ